MLDARHTLHCNFAQELDNNQLMLPTDLWYLLILSPKWSHDFEAKREGKTDRRFFVNDLLAFYLRTFARERAIGNWTFFFISYQLFCCHFKEECCIFSSSHVLRCSFTEFLVNDERFANFCSFPYFTFCYRVAVKKHEESYVVEIKDAEEEGKDFYDQDDVPGRAVEFLFCFFTIHPCVSSSDWSAIRICSKTWMRCSFSWVSWWFGRTLEPEMTKKQGFRQAVVATGARACGLTPDLQTDTTSSQFTLPSAWLSFNVKNRSKIAAGNEDLESWSVNDMPLMFNLQLVTSSHCWQVFADGAGKRLSSRRPLDRDFWHDSRLSMELKHCVTKEMCVDRGGMGEADRRSTFTNSKYQCGCRNRLRSSGAGVH